MIRMGCLSCKNMHQVKPEELEDLLKAIQACGPSEKNHMVIRFDCEGRASIEEVENPGWALQSVAEQIGHVESLEELFKA